MTRSSVKSCFGHKPGPLPSEGPYQNQTRVLNLTVFQISE